MSERRFAPGERAGVNALRNAFMTQANPDFDAAMAAQRASGKGKMGAKRGPNPNGGTSARADYWKERAKRDKSRRCAGCGYLVSRDRDGRCIECHARANASRTRYLTTFEADLLEQHAGLKTAPQFARYMAIHHGIYRTQQGWMKAAYKRDIKFLTHQPTVTAKELATQLGVSPKWVVKRIERGEILTVGKGGARAYLIPVEVAERIVAEAPTKCPFDDPLTIDEAADLMGFNRSYFIDVMNSAKAGLDPWLGPDRFKRISRAKVLALKERMVAEGLTGRDLMDDDRAEKLRREGREGLKKLRDTRRQQRTAPARAESAAPRAV